MPHQHKLPVPPPMKLSTGKNNSNASFSFNKPLAGSGALIAGPKFVTNKYKLGLAKKSYGGPSSGRPPLSGTRNNNYMMSGESSTLPKNLLLQNN